jgi:ATP-dependent Clp protease ATP-binding subunit ClpA
MFERFTESARAVLVEAEQLALELDSSSIEVGHILYGCAEGLEETAGRPLHDCGVSAALIRGRLPRGTTGSEGELMPPAADADPEALRAIGIDYDGVQAAVEATFGRGALERAADRRVAPRGRKPRFAIDAKRSLEQALRVAVELHHNRITPGHLLLGLLRLDDAFVSETIEQSGTTVVALSAAVLEELAAAA